MSNFIKKSFLISMVVMTAFFGFGFAVNVASANVASAGDLIKSTSSPAVYYLDSNNVKHPFHHEREYLTWYSDFSNIKTVPTDEMVGYTLGSTVVVRPGTRLIQYVEVLGDGTWNTSNTPEVYAVGPNGQTHKIDSAATAVAKYGSNWESMIVPLPNYLSANYTGGSALTSSSMYPAGTLVKMADSSQVYYIDGSSKRPVTDAGFSGNRFNMDYVLTVSDLSAYTDGTSITAAEDGVASPMSGAGVVVAPGSGLTVALAAGNPGAQVAPIGATGIELMKINLTAAADGAVSVSDIAVTRNGVGATSDWSNLYMYDGATRLTSGKTINSTSHKAQFNNLGITIPAGSTKTLTVVGETYYTAGTTCATQGQCAASGNVHYFTIGSSDITTTASLNGSFPVMSNTTTIGSTISGTITIAENGSLSSPSIGDSNAKVAQFTLQAGSAEDLKLKRLSLYQAGSINNSYLTNFKLYQGSTMLGSAASINDKSLIVFDLGNSPYTLEKGQTRTFYVTADVNIASRSGDTSKIYLDQASDLYAVGAAYGYGVSVTSSSYDGADSTCTSESTCDDSTYLAMQGGQVTVSNNGPVATSYAQDADDLVMLDFSITTAVPVEIRNWRVELHNAGTDVDSGDAELAYIDNIRIVATDGTFGTDSKDATSFTDITGDNQGVYTTYTDTLSLGAGVTKNFQILMDTTSSVSVASYYMVLGSTVSGSTYAFSSTALRGDNNQYVTDIVPSSYVQGKNMDFSAASLTTALGNFTGDQVVVKGTSDAEVLYYNLTASNSANINISSIQFASYIDDDDGTTGQFNFDDADNDVYVQDVINNFKLYVKEGSTYTQIGTVESVSSGYITFDNLDWTINAGDTKTIVLKGDVSNSAYFNSNDDVIAFDILTGGISATYGSGTDLGSVTANRNNASAGVTTAAVTMTDFSARVSVTNTGTLTVSENDNPQAANLVAGTNGANVLNLRFNGQNESFRIEKLRIIQSQTSANGGDRAVNGVKIVYTNEAGSTVENTQSLANGIADFDVSSDPIYVAANGVANVAVYANLRQISANASDAKSGDQLTFGFDEGANFRAVGSTVITDSNWSEGTDVNGNTMTVRKAIPTFTKIALSDSTLLVNNSNVIYKFMVSASEGSSVDLKKVALKAVLTGKAAGASLTLDQITVKEDDLTLTKGDGGTNHYRVYAGNGATTAATNKIDGDTTGLLSSTATAQDMFIAFNDDRTISASGSKTYTVSGVLGYTATGSTNAATFSVRTYLADADASVSTGALGYIDPYAAGDSATLAYSKYGLANSSGTGDTGAYYIWSDHSGTNGNNVHQDADTGHPGSSAAKTGGTSGTTVTISGDWTNGYLLKTLGSDQASTLTITNQ